MSLSSASSSSSSSVSSYDTTASSSEATPSSSVMTDTTQDNTSASSSSPSKEDGLANANWWTRTTAKVADSVDRGLAHIAFRSAKSPWKVIGITLTVTLLCAVALFIGIQKVESDGDTLWVPRGNESAKLRNKNKEYFPEATGTRFDTFLFVGKNNANVITKAHLQELWSFHNTITSMTVEHGGRTWSYSDLCTRAVVNGAKLPYCQVTSPLQYWQMDQATFDADPAPENTIRDVSGSITGRGGSFIYLPEIVGSRDNADIGPYTTARAYRSVYYLSGENQGAAEAFESKIIGQLGQLDSSLTLFQLRAFLDMSPDEELENSTGGDIMLFVGAVLLIAVFCSVIVTRVSKTLYGHWLLAQVSLLQSFMAVGISFGLNTYFQVPFVSFISFLLFLMVGVGVDNCIIVINEFDRTDRSLSIEERVHQTYGHIGASITLTNLTSFLAFAIGATAVFPAITYFCAYAALALLALFSLTMTFFAACLTVDARRIAKGRMDILPCIVSTHQRDNPPEQGDEALLTKFFRTIYAPLLLKRPVQVVILLLFIGWFGFSIYGTTQVEQGLDQRKLFRKDSYLVAFLNSAEDHFNLPTPVQALVLPPEGGPAFKSLAGQKAMEELTTLATDVAPDVIGYRHWYPEFLAYIASTKGTSALTEGKYAPETMFNTWVAEFLSQAQYLGFQSDILLETGTGEMRAYKWIIRTRALSQAERVQGKDIMLRLRHSLNKSPLEVYDTYVEYIFYETDLVIVNVTIQNLGLVLAAVVVVCSLLLVSPIATVFVVIVIIMINIDVFCLMYLWDIPLDAVAMVNLIMAVGFSVDFSAHIAHAFMMHSGDTESRIIGSVSEMGTSILYGGISTFLGMLLLGFASSNIFNTFFKMFVGIVLFGLSHGLIFLPALLAVFAPAPSPLASHGDDSKSMDSITAFKAARGSRVAPGTEVSPV